MIMHAWRQMAYYILFLFVKFPLASHANEEKHMLSYFGMSRFSRICPTAEYPVCSKVSRNDIKIPLPFVTRLSTKCIADHSENLSSSSLINVFNSLH